MIIITKSLGFIYGEEFSYLRAQVYTLGSDSWREIIKMIEGDDSFLDNCYFSTIKEVYCKGVYYWILRMGYSLDEAIQSVNVHDEEFHNIPLRP